MEYWSLYELALICVGGQVKHWIVWTEVDKWILKAVESELQLTVALFSDEGIILPKA